MRKIILLLLMVLLPSSLADSMDRESTRKALLAKLGETTEWCMKNNEEIAAGVLYTLNASLIIGQDSLLLRYLYPFNVKMVEIVKQYKRNLY